MFHCLNGIDYNAFVRQVNRDRISLLPSSLDTEWKNAVNETSMAHSREKIILTGYRATGKSTLGRMLADRLGYQFIDTDKEIEERQGCSISEMVALHGWKFFRQKEREFLQELVLRSRVVIAAGGGAIEHREAWSELIKSGFSVWLVADRETICSRLEKDGHLLAQRPSLTGKDIRQEISEVIAAREPLYREGSHFSIDSGALSADEAVKAILAAMEADPGAASC